VFATAVFRSHQHFARFFDDFFEDFVFAFVQKLGNVGSFGIAAFAGVDGVLDLGEDGVGHGIFGFEG